MNTGLFGGTFDPPHIGHLIVAQDAALALGLDRVLFVPAASPPHKADTAISPAPIRARMLELAIAGDERFACDRIELERSGPSWTIDTLRSLHEREPDMTWTLLVGADQYAELDTWRDPAGIRRLARIAVLTRGGRHGGSVDAGAAAALDVTDPLLGVPAVRTLADGAVAVEVTRIDVSATAIRRRVAAGLPIRHLVPAAVEAFIFDQRLYASKRQGGAGVEPRMPATQE